MMDKFSFAQMTSNKDGKTSGSGTLGVFAGFAGILAFLYGCVDYSFMSKDGNIMTQSIVVLTIGAGLLGYRKFKGDATNVETTESTSVETTGETTSVETLSTTKETTVPPIEPSAEGEGDK